MKRKLKPSAPKKMEKPKKKRKSARKLMLVKPDDPFNLDKPKREESSEQDESPIPYCDGNESNRGLPESGR